MFARFIFGAVCLLTLPAAFVEGEYETTGAVYPACLLPGSLDDAWAAMKAGDDTWLKSLNCLVVKPHLKVVFISTLSGNTYAYEPHDIVKLRVIVPSGEGVTLWTYGATIGHISR